MPTQLAPHSFLPFPFPLHVRRPLLDLRVSITGGVHFDLVKRVMRDISRSGQDAEGIISQVGGGSRKTRMV